MKGFSKLGKWARGQAVCLISAGCAGISLFFVPPNGETLAAVDWRVLGLLLCLMAVVAGLQSCGLFGALAGRLLTGRKSLRLLATALILLPFFCSMLVTNDVALLVFVPFSILVLSQIGRREHLIPVVVLQTLAANLGSMATPVGNPQNLYLYNHYAISPADFFATLLPPVLLSLIGLLTACCFCLPNEHIEVRFLEMPQIGDKRRLALYLTLFLLCLLAVFHLLPVPLLTSVVLAILFLFDRKLFRHIDVGLLLTFFFFFIFAGNLGKIPAVRETLTALTNAGAGLTAICASQIISNVPAALLLSGFTDNWQGLLTGVNIGGLGTPIASLASLISLRLYLQVEGARGGRYLLWFLLANLTGLALLTGFAALLGML